MIWSFVMSTSLRKISTDLGLRLLRHWRKHQPAAGLTVCEVSLGGLDLCAGELGALDPAIHSLRDFLHFGKVIKDDAVVFRRESGKLGVIAARIAASVVLIHGIGSDGKLHDVFLGWKFARHWLPGFFWSERDHVFPLVAGIQRLRKLVWRSHFELFAGAIILVLVAGVTASRRRKIHVTQPFGGGWWWGWFVAHGASLSHVYPMIRG